MKKTNCRWLERVLGSQPNCMRDLIRQIHAAQEILKAWVRAERIEPQVCFEQIGDIGGFLLVGRSTLACPPQGNRPALPLALPVPRSVPQFNVALWLANPGMDAAWVCFAKNLLHRRREAMKLWDDKTVSGRIR